MIVLIAAIATVIIALIIVVIKSVAAPKKVEGIKKLLKQGKNQAAAKLAKQIIAKEPTNFQAHYYLGKAYMADNRGELALMEYKIVNEKALFDASLPEIPFRKELASLLLKYNQKEDALKEYLLLTKQDSRDPEVFLNAGKLSEQINRKDMALGFYNKCIKLDPKNAQAHAAIGYILYQAKHPQEAKKELDLAIRLNPETYSCYYYLGKLLKDNKDLAGAVKAFEKAQRDNEYKQKALIERGTCYIMANRLDNAMIDLQRAIEVDKSGNSSDTIYAQYFLATCYEKTRKIPKAIELWEQIYKQNKSFRDVAAKLTEYKDLQSNDCLKDFLTSSEIEFIEICKNMALKTLNLATTQADSKKSGCVLLCTEAKNDDWRNNRKFNYLLRFYRDPEPVEDVSIRELLDQGKKFNCTKCYFFSSTTFTRSAVNFAESRPIELVPKEKLEKLLEDARSLS